MKSKGFLQRIYNFNAGVASRLDKRIDKNMGKVFDHFEKGLDQLFDRHNPLAFAVEMAASNVSAYKSVGQRLLKLPFVAARGTIRLAAKAARRPLDTTPKL